MKDLIRLENICFSYPGGKPVLEGLDFSLRPEEKIALLGSNGSGKTTLLNLIVGLAKPFSGTLTAFGKTMKTESDFQKIRKKAGLVFQNPEDQLFCPSVIEDVSFGPLNLGLDHAEAEKVSVETLEMLEISDLKDRVTYTLSHGEKRLVSLASVLSMRPEALLLDEPLSGLDDEHREKTEKVLAELGHSMVIVSHEKDFISHLATHKVRLESGRILG